MHFEVEEPESSADAAVMAQVGPAQFDLAAAMRATWLGAARPSAVPEEGDPGQNPA
jgi:hypothetical protein